MHEMSIELSEWVTDGTMDSPVVVRACLSFNALALTRIDAIYAPHCPLRQVLPLFYAADTWSVVGGFKKSPNSAMGLHTLYVPPRWSREVGMRTWASSASTIVGSQL